MKLLLTLFTTTTAILTAAPLPIPAHSAYLDPEINGASIREDKPITGWNKPGLNILWFGEIKTAGSLNCEVELKLSPDSESKLRLTVGSQSREVTARADKDGKATAKFGDFKIEKPGYQKFTLESRNSDPKKNGDVVALLLDGPAAKDAHFSTKERRNAASIHLGYPIPKDTNVQGFYCEATAVEDPVASYYMVCGWHRGYFGMQVNSPTERRIIFSVWDSGNEAVSRDKVGHEDRVTLIAKGEGVNSGDFGNEGTGGHSHLKYNWKTGTKQRFFITAKPVDETHTVYSGYWFNPDHNRWMLISSWKSPKDGGWLKGLYSFSENFGGANGHLRRKALYGNQWILTDKDQWLEVTEARFTHDGHGKADRLDRFMGVENGQFFLSQGGFIEGFTKGGESFTRPATGKRPTDLNLPPLPIDKK